MTDIEIKNLLEKSNKKLSNAIKKHDEEMQNIRSLCPHNKLGQHNLNGNPCLICGDIIPTYKQKN